MKRMFAGIFGALLVLGLVGALSTPASAGGYGYNAACNCYGPVVKIVNAGTRVITSHRTFTTNRVIPRVRVIDRNQVIVHRRTVVHRKIVTHRHNTHHRHVTVNRINTAHKFETVHKNQVVNRRVNTSSRSHSSKTVKGRDCECAPGQRNFKGMAHWRKHAAISSRN
jgi:hypothetical protein